MTRCVATNNLKAKEAVEDVLTRCLPTVTMPRLMANPISLSLSTTLTTPSHSHTHTTTHIHTITTFLQTAPCRKYMIVCMCDGVWVCVRHGISNTHRTGAHVHTSIPIPSVRTYLRKSILHEVITAYDNQKVRNSRALLEKCFYVCLWYEQQEQEQEQTKIKFSQPLSSACDLESMNNFVQCD